MIYVDKEKKIEYRDCDDKEIRVGDILEIQTCDCEIPYYAEVKYGKYYYTNYYDLKNCGKLKGEGYYLDSLNKWKIGTEDIRDCNKNLIKIYTNRDFSPNFVPREPYPLQRIINNPNQELIKLRQLSYDGKQLYRK